MIGIVDYGMGNLGSVAKALTYLGQEVKISGDPRELAAADRLILPGVGAFEAGMNELNRKGLVQPLRAFAASGKPFLGICLGMQMLFEGSAEGHPVPGLCLLPGQLQALPPVEKVPHMGWNTLTVCRPCPLTRGLPAGAEVYFVHSFAFLGDGDFVVARSEHGVPFAALVQRGNVFGAQFHPEKSGAIGLKMLENFVHLEAAHGL